MITIYHNPRCRKSREGLAILEDSGLPFEIRKYLEEPLSKAEIIKTIELLGLPAIDLIRKGEAIWKEHFKGKELSDNDLVEAMTSYPKLIERPIVIANNKGIIGRPPENIKSIL
jgi:arsenate reductase